MIYGFSLRRDCKQAAYRGRPPRISWRLTPYHFTQPRSQTCYFLSAPERFRLNLLIRTALDSTSRRCLKHFRSTGYMCRENLFRRRAHLWNKDTICSSLCESGGYHEPISFSRLGIQGEGVLGWGKLEERLSCHQSL